MKENVIFLKQSWIIKIFLLRFYSNLIHHLWIWKNTIQRNLENYFYFNIICLSLDNQNYRPTWSWQWNPHAYTLSHLKWSRMENWMHFIYTLKKHKYIEFKREFSKRVYWNAFLSLPFSFGRYFSVLHWIRLHSSCTQKQCFFLFFFLTSIVPSSISFFIDRQR